jgi:ATP-dependent DNA helicase RecQ
MLALCESITCRRVRLLEYFGQHSTACNNCDICLYPPTAYNGTVTVQKLLSAIYRVDQRFGANHVIDVLRGIESEKIKQWQHERLSTFGIGVEFSEAEWRAVLRQTIALGLVIVDHDAYHALKLTDKARPVLRGEEIVQLRQYQKPIKTKRIYNKPHADIGADLSPQEQILFDKLRWWRVETARKHNVPAYVILHDATLREIAKGKPNSLYALRGVSGVGEKKLETYGDEIVTLINNSIIN